MNKAILCKNEEEFNVVQRYYQFVLGIYWQGQTAFLKNQFHGPRSWIIVDRDKNKLTWMCTDPIDVLPKNRITYAEWK